MADIGSASLLIVPRFDNLTSSVNSALSGASSTASASGASLGKSTASGFGTGLLSSGALIGAFSSITNAAMSSISAHVSDAISRFDTLNNYPTVMQNLGFSAEEADASISLMSDRLTGLPTALDDMASVVSGLSVITEDLDLATRAGLALNDMLVASGSDTALATSAMEQFRQMLSKGEPELEDWKSLMSAMPGQMKQLAQEMLGASASTDDLYAALGGGKNEATIAIDELLAAMIKLDTEGGDGITSFAEQAQSAAGGVATSITNMGTAITRGLTGILDEVGKENISTFFSDASSVIKEGFGIAQDAVGDLMPLVEDLYGTLKDVAPSAITAVAAFAGFRAAGTGVANLVSTMGRLADAGGDLAGVNSALGTSFSPVSVGIAAVAAAAAIGVTAYLDWQEKTENLEAATQGLSDVVADTSALDDYRATVDGIGESAGSTAMSVDELAESTASHVEAMRANTEEAETTIAQLNTAQGIINAYAGQTDLSTEAQGRLEWALSLVNDELGLAITQQDVINGQYTDQDGNVQDLTDSLNGLIEARKAEARTEAVTANLTEAYQAQSDAAKTLVSTQREYNDAYAGLLEYYQEDLGWSEERAKRQAEQSLQQQGLTQDLEDAKDMYEEATDAVSELEEELGTVSAATSDAADALDTWAANVGPLFEATMEENGQSIDDLKEDLRTLGADTTDLGDLEEDELLAIAEAYDGTAASIVGALADAGVGMDEAAQNTAQAAADISDALADLGDGSLTASLEEAGVSVSDFAQKLAEAGVSTQTLNSIGSENLAALATACGGNMDMMVWYIQNYNSTPLINKDGTVNLDDAQLIDAQGNVYTWNGSTLVDKDGNAIIEDTQLTDAQGHLYTWNGSNLEYKSNTGEVYDLMSDGIKQRDRWNSEGLKNYEATGTINIFQNITRTISEVFGNAAGGFRLNAAGGFRPRFHAGGAIATRAVPLDIVGEDGAEAIVPLTNRKYAQPFIDMLAEGIGAQRAGTVVNQVFSTKVVRSDSDLYTAAPIIYRNAMKEARSVS